MVEFGVALSVILSLLAAATAVFTLLVHVRYPDLAGLVAEVKHARAEANGVGEELEALRDSLEHHQRRAAARARREGATARAEGGSAGGPGGAPAYAPVNKAELRAQLVARSNAGNFHGPGR